MPLFKKATFLSLFLLIQSGAGIFGTAMVLDTRYEGVIQQGITVKDIPVGGLNLVDATQKLESALPFPLENSLEIKGAGKSYFINLSEIGGRYDYHSSVEEALKYGKKGTDFNQLISILQLRAKPADFTLKIAFSEEKLAERIKSLQREWDATPKNAEIGMSDEKVVIIEEKPGYSLDFEKTLEQARRALVGGNITIAAVGKSLEPVITAANLESINAILAEYTTTFDAGAENRTHNIKIAAAAINGSLLRPGEIFSLNQRLGPRLAEAGYLKAPVFIEGRLALDIGGGVCQVATTLYNTVLLADLKVLERSSHPLPVGYVPMGRDATIAGDYLDLKFANNMNNPVYITAKVDAGTLSVCIYGAKEDSRRTVRITSEKTTIEPNVIIYEDDTLPEGETRIENHGKEGYEARVYREVTVDGQIESKTLISSDYYEPVDKIIYVGPKPKEEGK